MESSELSLSRKRILLIPLMAGILLLAMAFMYYKNESDRAEDESYKDLMAIGKLKSAQISNWYKERSLDAAYYSTSPTILNELDKFNKTGELNRKRLLERFSPIIEREVYEEILITDTTGNLIFSLNENYTIKSSPIFDGLINTIRTKNITTLNLYFCPYHQTIHNDIMAPMVIDDVVEAILIMRINPRDYLYPYIQNWPVESETAETVLAARDGDSAVYLNEIRKKPNSALKFKLPLTDTIAPGVAVVAGKTGNFEGIDYNGDKVLSNLSQITGTTWFLAVKVNKSEVYNDVISKTLMFTTFVVFIVAFLAGSLVLSYKRKQEIFLRIKEKRDHDKFSEELNMLVDQRTRELKKMHEDLLNFTHVISHDLKEPVRKIKFLISILKQIPDNEDKADARAYLDRIEISNDRLRELIQGIQNYNEVQDTHYDIKEVDLSKCTKKILSDLDYLIETKGAQITVKKMPKIHGINILLYKLLYNLIENSLKFTRQDIRPVIELDYHEITRDGKQFVEIVITDNGIGFDEKYAGRIFEPFKRLNTKDTFEGAGLGLAICKKIVERHHGDIYARSRNNSGATFHVLLPVGQSMLNVLQAESLIG